MKNALIKVMSIFVALSICISMICIIPVKTCAATLTFINSVRVDKARYNPRDTATISAELTNNSGSDWNGTLYFEAYHNETEVHSDQQSISLSNGQSDTKIFQWILPSTNYQGYLVKIYTSSDDVKAAAVDVSSSWTRFPRYGYIADFGSDITKEEITKQINALTQDYYINAFQFYDWAWRHEVPIKRSNDNNIDTTWTDLFGRIISWDTLKNYINAVHDKNSAAMAYMMSYAAREGYSDYGVNPEWGLFSDSNHQNQLNVNFNNGKYLWLFAPTNTNWQKFIGNAYIDSINTAGFDGIQMDQMGQRNNVFDYSGNSYDLSNSFSSFINSIKNILNSNNPQKSYTTFNIVDGTVNGWALNDISKNSNTDFNFSEIWWLANNYNDLRDYIEQLRNNSNEKATVLAAYMNYEDNCGYKYEAEDAVYKGVDIANNHTGFTGTGFLENFAQQGDYVQFTVSIPESKTYPLVFQYGDNSDEAVRSIYVDNQRIGQVQFHSQGTWDKFVSDAYIDTYLSSGTHSIKISYDSTDSGAINLDNLTLGQFDSNSVKLTDATLAASGASHIELGAGMDDVTMLANEYYPNKSKAISLDLKSWLKQYYKFITAYENLLYDPCLTYSDQGNQYMNIDGQTISGSGTAGSIYHITRMTPNYDILHLINLSSENDQQWRNTTSTPILKKNLSIKYYLSSNSNISGVYFASPDSNDGISQSLPYNIGTDGIGKYVSFIIPSLNYWDMIYINRNIPVPSGQIYEAESAIKTNVTVNTNHTGYSGSGFVDGFAESGDEVTFQVNVQTPGLRTLSFKYANQTGYPATRHIYIDGSYAGTISMENQANWNTWSTKSMQADMTEGIHTICIYFDTTDSHAINLDSLTIS